MPPQYSFFGQCKVTKQIRLALVFVVCLANMAALNAQTKHDFEPDPNFPGTLGQRRIGNMVIVWTAIVGQPPSSLEIRSSDPYFQGATASYMGMQQRNGVTKSFLSTSHGIVQISTSDSTILMAAEQAPNEAQMMNSRHNGKSNEANRHSWSNVVAPKVINANIIPPEKPVISDDGGLTIHLNVPGSGNVTMNPKTPQHYDNLFVISYPDPKTNQLVVVTVKRVYTKQMKPMFEKGIGQTPVGRTRLLAAISGPGLIRGYFVQIEQDGSIPKKYRIYEISQSNLVVNSLADAPKTEWQFADNWQDCPSAP